jgi:hypothetical protein
MLPSRDTNCDRVDTRESIPFESQEDDAGGGFPAYDGRYPPRSRRRRHMDASFDTQVGVQNYTYTFKVDGGKLTGHAKSQFADVDIQEGSVNGDNISFVENLTFQDQPLRIEYTGKLSGDEIKFTRKVADVASETFIAKRSK